MKFLIADDHELFRQGLEFILKKEYPGIKLYVAGPDLYSIQWYKINGYQK